MAEIAKNIHSQINHEHIFALGVELFFVTYWLAYSENVRWTLCNFLINVFIFKTEIFERWTYSKLS